MNDRLKSNLEYQKRINNALAYVRENLDKTISLKEVARAACFSPFHFHRIFTALMQETLGEYITRKKLERAAIKLAYSDVNVTNVAFDYGYSSVSSFSKAFNQWFGCRPTEISGIKQRLESGKGKLQTKYNKLIDSEELFVGPSDGAWAGAFHEIDRRVKIDSIPEFELFYLTSPDGYDSSSIKNTWGKLIEILEDNHIDQNDCARFAISHDHPGLTPSAMCRYDACVTLPRDPPTNLDLAKTTVPGGRYAVFPVEGPENTILEKYLEFYTVWMPRSGYEPDDFPVLEHYLPTCRADYIVVELWAKIKRLPLI
jgi:AraC family transcriptional regulator